VKIEHHNAHGMQLVMLLSPVEALALARKLIDTASRVVETDLNHFVDMPCLFENDNDRWEPTDFDVVVEGNPVLSEDAGCQPTYPCNKHCEQEGSIPAGPCDHQVGHEHRCYRRWAKPDYSLPWVGRK
jgi:hypothetical protein